jgi:hypothetical protein
VLGGQPSTRRHECPFIFRELRESQLGESWSVSVRGHVVSRKRHGQSLGGGTFRRTFRLGVL